MAHCCCDNGENDECASVECLVRRAVRLIDVQAASDPPELPHRSLYAGQRLLNKARELLELRLHSLRADKSHSPPVEDTSTQYQQFALLQSDSSEAGLATAKLAVVLLRLGQVDIDSEQPSDGERWLLRCLQVCGVPLPRSDSAVTSTVNCHDPTSNGVTHDTVRSCDPYVACGDAAANQTQSNDAKATPQVDMSATNTSSQSACVDDCNDTAEKPSTAVDNQSATVICRQTEQSTVDNLGKDTSCSDVGNCDITDQCQLVLDHQLIISAVTALNRLAVLYSDRARSHASLCVLRRAEALYVNYTRTHCASTAVAPLRLFHSDAVSAEQSAADNADEERALEDVHTLTLFYLAQAYMAAGQQVMSAVYCHNTLARQLPTVLDNSDDSIAKRTNDRLEWARNAATLAHFYAPKHMFVQARHHLAAAEHVLIAHAATAHLPPPAELNAGSYASASDNRPNDEAMERRADYLRCVADVGRCWAELALCMLQASTDRLVKSQTPPPAACARTSALYFAGVGGLARLERQLPHDTYVTRFGEARAVFLCGQKWLLRARRFYTLQEHASDCVQVVRQHSRLYKALVFFEVDVARQCRMYKRRVDLLAPLVAQLSVRHYLAQVRQLLYELGEVYSELAQCKVDIQRERDKRRQHVTVRVVDKINALALQSIGYFERFLDTVRSPVEQGSSGVSGSGGVSDGSEVESFAGYALPTVLDESLTRPVLIAYFHLGHLYNRLMDVELRPKLANLQRSLAAYQLIVDYCDRVPAAAQLMADELPACRQLLQLLPAKLLKVRNAVNSGARLATEVQY